VCQADSELDYVQTNSLQWDKWVEDKCIWTIPITHDEFVRAAHGDFSLFVTPTIPIPKEWLGELVSYEVLGLASAGGQQIPLLAAQGAKVTVFDNSSMQLNSEKAVAIREQYNVTTVQGDMTRRLPFDDCTFDYIINPVSNSYISDVRSVWKECYRILKHKGILISGFANPVVYMFDAFADGLSVKNKLPLNPLADYAEDVLKKVISRDGVQFSHTLEEQINGQLQAGLILTDLFEDFHPVSEETKYDTYIGSIASRLTKYMPIYIATRSIKY